VTYTVPPASMTFNVSASGDDGTLSARGSTYPPSGTPIPSTDGIFLTAGRRFAFGNYWNLDTLIRFDTSALPDNATITFAKLRFDVTAKTNADDFNLVGDWYAGSNWPIDSSDYVLTTPGAALSTAVGSLPTQAVSERVLTTTTGISTTGFSGLRLLLDGGQPSGDNYVQMASFDNGGFPAPQLVVSYTLP